MCRNSESFHRTFFSRWSFFSRGEDASVINTNTLRYTFSFVFTKREAKKENWGFQLFKRKLRSREFRAKQIEWDCEKFVGGWGELKDIVQSLGSLKCRRAFSWTQLNGCLPTLDIFFSEFFCYKYVHENKRRMQDAWKEPTKKFDHIWTRKLNWIIFPFEYASRKRRKINLIVVVYLKHQSMEQKCAYIAQLCCEGGRIYKEDYESIWAES